MKETTIVTLKTPEGERLFDLLVRVNRYFRISNKKKEIDSAIFKQEIAIFYEQILKLFKENNMTVIRSLYLDILAEQQSKKVIKWIMKLLKWN